MTALKAHGRARPAACFALLAMLSAAPTPAQPPADPACPPNPTWPDVGPMRFRVEQLDGAPVLIGEGVIDAGTLPRLRQVLDGFQGDEMRLRSPGGDARAGNLAGNLIRARMLKVRIPAGWACASSCAFMFLGGILRYVDEGGLLLVQMSSDVADAPALHREMARDPERADRLLTAIARDSALMASEDNDYLIRMGVSRRFLTELVYRHRAFDESGRPLPPYCLSADELRRYNVVNTVPPHRSEPADSAGTAK